MSDYDYVTALHQRLYCRRACHNMPDGYFEVAYPRSESITNLYTWIDTYTVGHFYLKNSQIAFKLEQDAVIYRLRFS